MSPPPTAPLPTITNSEPEARLVNPHHEPIKRVALLLVVFALTIFVSAKASRVLFPLAMDTGKAILTSALTLLAVTFALVRMFRLELDHSQTRKPVDWKLLFAAIGGMGLMISFHFGGVVQIDLDTLRLSAWEFPNTATLILLYAIVPAITEEICFRGLIQRWLTAITRPWQAVFVTAFFFSLAHLNFANLPYFFSLGCLFGWITHHTGNLKSGMILHALHNLTVLMLPTE